MAEGIMGDQLWSLIESLLPAHAPRVSPISMYRVSRVVETTCPSDIDSDIDGSIRMNMGELETASTYDVPVKLMLLNNRGDGMIRSWQRLFYEGRMFISDKALHRKDFVMPAQANGFEFARRVQATGELEDCWSVDFLSRNEDVIRDFAARFSLHL
jgi:hypothetical protein